MNIQSWLATNGNETNSAAKNATFTWVKKTSWRAVKIIRAFSRSASCSASGAARKLYISSATKKQPRKRTRIAMAQRISRVRSSMR